MGDDQEMSLEEWVERLPVSHRARGELERLQARDEKQVVEKILAMGAESLNPDTYEDLVGICELLRVRRKALESDIELDGYSKEMLDKYKNKKINPDYFGTVKIVGTGEKPDDNVKAQKQAMKESLIPLIHAVNEKYEGDKEQTLEWWTGLFADVAVEVIAYLYSYMGMDITEVKWK